MIGAEARQRAEAALGRLDRIIEERPREVHADLAEAVRGIVAVRDDLIRLGRRDDGPPGLRERLREANVLVSIGVSAEFPVTGLHWERIEKTRDGLRGLLRQL